MLGEVMTKGRKGLPGLSLRRRGVEGAEEVGGDGDVVGCGGRVDGDDGHGLYGSAGRVVVSCRFCSCS